MLLKNALLVTAVCLALTHNASAQPLAEVERRIVAVPDWGGTAADATLARKHTITHITLHHQGEPFKPGTDPVKYLRNLQSWSRTTKHWLDIPYHYVIDLDGRIYEGRNIAYAGDTNTEYDPLGHALIEVVGNFEDVEPNQKQLDAVVDLMAMLAAKYNVPLERIASHRDYSKQTVCPGANLYRYVQQGYFREKVAERLARKK
ncbi:peptidoglycan recognition protein family protein [Massilia horti]|uniref:N-acetylmuramoyl-L-alanine amidase n=1 Tax=Massilia horti TaxID=2562153 RepID=A0A4Y9SPT3_9BURK|nr:peptidoglycan recognition family protein [Massilia horti]TFW27487.1 N-acetylmuramoyl-L-alanine amidase [Massilia horti]